MHLVGLGILSGSHMPLVAEVVRLMREAGIGHVPVVVGGIIPRADHAALREAGVARVYTPEHYDLDAMMEDLVGVVEESMAAAV